MIRVSGVFDRILSILATLCSVLLFFMMLIVCYEVVMRYFFNSPTSWVVDISSFILLFFPFLVGAWIFKRDEHVRMDLLLTHLSPNRQATLNTITYFVAAAVSLTLTYYGFTAAHELYEMGYRTETNLIIPKWPILAVIPVGFFFLFLQSLRKAFECVRGLKSGE